MAGGGIKFNNIKVIGGADGKTPVFKIENGILYYTYGSGENAKWYDLGLVKGADGQNGKDGKNGSRLVSQILEGQDENGGNIYKQTFDDGTTAYFVAPKGEGGGGSSGGGTIIIGEKVKVLISAWEKLENSQPYFYQATMKVATPLTENSRVSIINDNPVMMANFGFEIGETNDSTQEITFFASVLPVGDVELTLSVIEGNKIIDKDGNVFVIEEEDATILLTDWIDLENAQPFSYQTTISVTAELGENTSVGIANDRPVFFARYGLMVGAIEGQQVTIYAIAKPPEESNTIKLTIMKEEQQ